MNSYTINSSNIAIFLFKAIYLQKLRKGYGYCTKWNTWYSNELSCPCTILSLYPTLIIAILCGATVQNRNPIYIAPSNKAVRICSACPFRFPRPFWSLIVSHKDVKRSWYTWFKNIFIYVMLKRFFPLFLRTSHIQ